MSITCLWNWRLSITYHWNNETLQDADFTVKYINLYGRLIVSVTSYWQSLVLVLWTSSTNLSDKLWISSLKLRDSSCESPINDFLIMLAMLVYLTPKKGAKWLYRHYCHYYHIPSQPSYFKIGSVSAANQCVLEM